MSRLSIIAASLLALGALAGCAAPPTDPRLGLWMDSGGTVHPSASGSFGGLRVGARPGGGSLSTSLGPIDLGAAF